MYNFRASPTFGFVSSDGQVTANAFLDWVAASNSGMISSTPILLDLMDDLLKMEVPGMNS
jgi:hypothetical protein